jgi:hypothetical protein
MKDVCDVVHMLQPSLHYIVTASVKTTELQLQTYKRHSYTLALAYTQGSTNCT